MTCTQKQIKQSLRKYKTNSLWQDAEQLCNIWASSNKRVWNKISKWPRRRSRLFSSSAQFRFRRARHIPQCIYTIIPSEIRQDVSSEWTCGIAGYLKMRQSAAKPCSSLTMLTLYCNMASDTVLHFSSSLLVSTLLRTIDHHGFKSSTFLTAAPSDLDPSLCLDSSFQAVFTSAFHVCSNTSCRC